MNGRENIIHVQVGNEHNVQIVRDFVAAELDFRHLRAERGPQPVGENAQKTSERYHPSERRTPGSSLPVSLGCVHGEGDEMFDSHKYRHEQHQHTAPRAETSHDGEEFGVGELGCEQEYQSQRNQKADEK